MALIKEDGTEVANANSYEDRTGADAYFALRPSGNTVWAALSDDQKDDNLIAATQYIELRFAPSFRGVRLTSAQVLSFPRDGAFTDAGDVFAAIPRELTEATAEYALRNSSSALLSDPTGEASEVLEQEDVVGPIKTRTKYAVTSGGSKSSLVSSQNINEYPVPDMMIAPLLKSGGMAIRN